MCYILKMRNFNRTQQKLEFQFTLGNKKLSKFACPVQVLHVVCYFNGLVSRSQGSENEKLHAQKYYRKSCCLRQQGALISSSVLNIKVCM